MKAMILAAGVGTRLKPLTDTVPKALIRIGDYTLLEIIIKRLVNAGINSLVINVHHFPDQIIDFLREHNHFGLDIQISDESVELLDTGGAIKKAAEFFRGEESVLVHNIDILSNLDISALIANHHERGALLTMAVKERPTTRSLLVDGSGRLCGWECPDRNLCIMTRDSRKGLKSTAFSGVYVFSAALLNKFPDETSFGLMPWLMDLAAAEKILTWDQSPSFWYEAGRLEAVEKASRMLSFSDDDPGFITENRT